MNFYEDFEENAIDEEFLDEVVCDVEDLEPKHVLSLGAGCVLTFGGALAVREMFVLKFHFLPVRLVRTSLSEDDPRAQK